MGRELKRVALDFQWEIGKIWSGYINPHPRHKCLECDGDGWSNHYKELEEIWYGWNSEIYEPNPFKEGSIYNITAWKNNLIQEDVDALIEADRLWEFTRTPLTEEQEDIIRKRIADGKNSWLPYNNEYRPTAKEVNEWNLKGMGHDSVNCAIIIKSKLKKEGKSHLCEYCNGEGENWQNQRAKDNYYNWESYEPPKGDGYQLWETTSDGSPNSPVFKTIEELCEWCEENATTFADLRATKEEWMVMLNDNFVYHKNGDKIFI